MASLLIPDLDDALHARLQARAAAQGRTVAEEAREVLRDTLDAGEPLAGESLWSAMRAVFEPLGGVELETERQPGQRPPPDFAGPEWDAHDRPVVAPP